MSKVFHQRTCLGCGVRGPQAVLVRLAVDPDGCVVLNHGRRAPGRGGYLHRDVACWHRFAQRKGSIRTLRRTISRPEREQLVARLRADSAL